MIYFIKTNKNEVDIIGSFGLRHLEKSIISTVKNLSMKYLFTYEGYVKSVRKTVGIKSLAPLYLNPQNLLMFLDSPRKWECIIINYFAITNFRYQNNEIEIEFPDQNTMYFKIGLNKFKRLISQATLVLKYIEYKNLDCLI